MRPSVLRLDSRRFDNRKFNHGGDDGALAPAGKREHDFGVALPKVLGHSDRGPIAHATFSVEHDRFEAKRQFIVSACREFDRYARKYFLSQ